MRRFWRGYLWGVYLFLLLAALLAPSLEVRIVGMVFLAITVIDRVGRRTSWYRAQSSR